MHSIVHGLVILYDLVRVILLRIGNKCKTSKIKKEQETQLRLEVS